MLRAFVNGRTFSFNNKITPAKPQVRGSHGKHNLLYHFELVKEKKKYVQSF